MDVYRLGRADAVAPRAWAGLAVDAAASFVVSLDAMVLYVAFTDIRRAASPAPSADTQHEPS